MLSATSSGSAEFPVPVAKSLLRQLLWRAKALLEFPFVNASLVEILKRPAHSSSPGGRTLEDIFQIVIMIFVQCAGGQNFLGWLQLAANETVFPTWRSFSAGPQ
jgi:hypothetical protein